jgi:hypothetical protein
MTYKIPFIVKGGVFLRIALIQHLSAIVPLSKHAKKIVRKECQ